jgi:signal transduction histidine kinase
MKKNLFSLFCLLIVTNIVFATNSEQLIIKKYTNIKNKACVDSACVDSMFKWVYNLHIYNIKIADSLSDDFLVYSNTHRNNYLNAKSHLLKAIVFDAQGKTIESISNTIIAIKNFGNTPSINLCFAYQQLARGYNMASSYKLANETTQKGLEMAEALKNNVLITNSYNFLGVNYNREKEYAKAISYFRKVISLNQHENDSGNLTRGYINLALSYRKMGNYDSSFYYIEKANKEAEELNDWYYEAYTQSDIGAIYLLKKEYNTAISFLQKAVAIREKNDEIYEVGWTYIFLGDCYWAKEEKKLATTYYHKAIAVSFKNENKQQRYEAYEQLSKMYYEYKKFDSAYYYNNRFAELKDSVTRSEFELSTAATIASYELEEKEKAIRLLDEIGKRQQAEIQKQKLLLLFTLIFIVTALIIIFLIIKERKQRVAKLKLEAELKEESIRRIAIENMQKEKERISRDLHDNVGGQLSYVLYSLEDFKKGDEQVQAETSKNINSSIRNVISSLRETIWAINDKEISVNDLSDRLKVYARNIFQNSQTKVRFTENIEINTMITSLVGLNLYRICQEIINNSFKYSKAKELTVSIHSSENITIIIMDDGVGFNPEDSNGDGYGLTNIKKRASETAIFIDMKSRPNEGTKYTLIV